MDELKAMSSSFFPFLPNYGREVLSNRIFCTTEEEFYRRISEATGIVDVYCSVYSFSSARNYNSSIVDRVFFDFDRAYTSSPYKDVLKLSDWCNEFNIKHTIISSGHGYHLHLFSKPLLHDRRPTLSNFQNTVVTSLGIHPDPHSLHGNLAALCRVPFTYNLEAKKFCLPIPREIFVKGILEVESYRKGDGVEAELIIDGKELLDLEQFVVKEKPLKGISSPVLQKLSGSIFGPEVSELPSCIQQILKKKAPEHYERYYLTTFFHWLASFGSYEMEQDQEAGLIEELIQFYSTLEWEDFDENKTRYQVENIVKEKYRMPNCEWVISDGDCPGLCGHYR